MIQFNVTYHVNQWEKRYWKIASHLSPALLVKFLYVKLLTKGILDAIIRHAHCHRLTFDDVTIRAEELFKLGYEVLTQQDVLDQDSNIMPLICIAR